MDTRAWGKPMWESMFMMAANFPEKIDKNNKNDKELVKHYKDYYTNLKFMLPCRFCRESYTEFIRELPIDDYLDSRRNIIFWVYKIKDKVNKKLITQEKILLELEIDKLKSDGSLTKMKIFELKNKILYTKSSPPFKEVYDKYMSFRAKTCSRITKKCI